MNTTPPPETPAIEPTPTPTEPAPPTTEPTSTATEPTTTAPMSGGSAVMPLSGTTTTVVWYVDDTATGIQDGKSWTNAFKYLQDALTNGICWRGDLGSTRHI